MRLSDLLRMDVVDERGRRLGQVHDVRFVSPDGGPSGWTATSLLVGTAGFAARLGYAHGAVRGPWALERLVRLLGRSGKEIAWDRVVRLDGDVILVRDDAVGFPHPSRTREDST